MDALLGFVCAAALVAAFVAFVYVIGESFHQRPRAAAASPKFHYQSTHAVCAPDGVAITSRHVLAMAVTMLDRMAETGRAPTGERVTMLDVSRAADRIAASHRVPTIALSMLEDCDDFQGRSYGKGLLQAALIRAAVARRQSAGLQ